MIDDIADEMECLLWFKKQVVISNAKTFIQLLVWIFVFLSHKVNDDQVEDDVCENEVGEGSFGADGVELSFVLGVHLEK